MTRLRVICDEGFGARGNIALTAAMAELHMRGEIGDTLRIYRYPRSVLLGCNQSAEEATDRTVCVKKNVEIARRITGGGAIYMDEGVITWDLVVTGRSVGNDPRGLSENVCRSLAGAISALGVDARFRAENDIVADNKKIAGASGYADGATFIYQGSLMLSPDLRAMAAVLRIPAIEDGVTTLSALLGRAFRQSEAAALLANSISSALGYEQVSGELSAKECALRDELFGREFGRDDFVFAKQMPRAAA